MHITMRFFRFIAIVSVICKTSSGVCVFGVIPKEMEKSELGSGLKDILGVRR